MTKIGKLILAIVFFSIFVSFNMSCDSEQVDFASGRSMDTAAVIETLPEETPLPTPVPTPVIVPTPELVSIELSLDVDTIEIGQFVHATVMASYLDVAEKTDVTSKVTFSFSEALAIEMDAENVGTFKGLLNGSVKIKALFEGKESEKELVIYLCTSGKVLGVWLDPDDTGLTADKNYLGEFTSFSGTETSAENYNYYSASAHPNVGPTPEGFVNNVFFYEGTDGLSFNIFSGMDEGGSHSNTVNMDIVTEGNSKGDRVLLSDDSVEIKNVSETDLSRLYEGRFWYGNNTDGGVIGPFQGQEWKMHIKILESG